MDMDIFVPSYEASPFMVNPVSTFLAIEEIVDKFIVPLAEILPKACLKHNGDLFIDYSFV